MALVIVIWLSFRAPIIVGSLTKQTIYLWILDSWRGQAETSKAKIMLVDDDSNEGIFKIKRICDEINAKAAFAIIPARIKKDLGDSLRQWQKEGFAICLHGYNHDRWSDWDYEAVAEDIHKSEELLSEMGFNTDKIKFVIPPYAGNTHAIRKAIKDKGYQMIMGANIINPDTEVFQLGRVTINSDTDLQELEFLLKKAKKRRMFVILGTHSSDSEHFSEEKTKAALQMAKDMDFVFNN